ncbi:hypothetical protein EDC65_1952 [Stella humosa]|uniref:VapC45 PIN like domain-containing protein n=1 Tax=Stella humosa TaxID=94 RepID=A0A3N1MG35_9PROT|nr:hypothetical protein [Stella humosa]ROQ00156.1 hypothetical protein EDC65_1952 [Stella humosa]BBK30610.1 hypothetical protein STHU_12440 [Stella humosa]
MKVFFDNCTSPVLAATLCGYIAHLGHEAIHIKDLPCGRHASDIEWIALLGADADEWLVVTGDGRIVRNKAERAAYRAAGLRGFVLEPGFQKTPLNQVASALLWRWPDMAKIASLVGGPALYSLPVRRGSRITTLPL